MSEPLRRDTLPVFPAPPDRPDCNDGWRLAIDGLVARRLVLDAQALRALPAAELAADFHCEEGWVVPGLHWRGVPISAVVAEAGPSAGARYLAVASGGFVAALPLDAIGPAEPLLAYALNGEPLLREHGGPLRLVAAGLICYRTVKWVDRISILAEPPNETAQEQAARRSARSPID